MSSLFSMTPISQTTSTVLISGPSVIPLTTIFTPPSNCNGQAGFEVAYVGADGTTGYNTDSDVQSASCYPSNYSEYQYRGGNWYSPGVCPLNYEYVATSFEGATTLAICCPPGFFTKGDEWSCTQVLSSTEGSDGVTVEFANPISVAWQASDLAQFTPASAPVKALALNTHLTHLATTTVGSGGGSTIQPGRSHSLSVKSTSPFSSLSTNTGSTSATNSRSASATTLSSHHTAHSQNRLSVGAAAGIAVGATIIGLALIAGLAFWFFRRYKLTPRKSPSTAIETASYPHNSGWNNTQSKVKAPAELDPERHILEVGDTGRPHEADASHVYHELRGDKY